ncbi:MAG: glycosyltransferase [Candidatus Omnitrophica bacterium]|nr:glycosyltransferase [Candidatus Omnitrophota bacterium]
MILIIQDGFYYPGKKTVAEGGGAISNYLLLMYLKYYFDVVMLTNVNASIVKDINIEGVEIRNVNTKILPKAGIINTYRECKMFSKQIRVSAELYKPNIIISSSKIIYDSVRIAKQMNIPSAIWVRAYENYFNIDELKYSSNLKKVDLLVKKILMSKASLFAFQNADLVLSNSFYMKNRVYEKFRVNSEVIYPPVEIIKNSEAGEKSRRVGFLKPDLRKGLNIVIDIAKNMKDTEFICFGKKPVNCERIEQDVKNLKFQGWCADQGRLFSSFRILLVPSLWDEPFGRVAVEAINYGVLPIISNKGGLPETVNQSDIIVNDPYNIELWIEKIEYYMNNIGIYNRSIHELKKHIEVFSVENQGKKLVRHLLNLINR